MKKIILEDIIKDTNLENKIIKDLKKNGLTYDDFLDKYNLEKNDTKIYISELRSKGYCISERSIAGEVVYKLDTFISPKAAISRLDVDEDFSFGFIGDTHLCAKTCRMDALESYYDEISSRGIHHVDHAGDLTDGIDVYKGQVNELEYHTLDDQIKFVINNYPKHKGITTHYITGNHDLKVLSRVGIDIGNIISASRPDLDYLGQIQAIINLGGIKIEMCHYKGSMAWSRGYRIQKYLRDYIGDAPQILGLGHKHAMEFNKVMNTYSFELGSFQGQNNFTKELGLSGPIGGWIVNIKQKDGVILKLTPEWLEF